MARAIFDKEDTDTLQAIWSAVHKRCPSVTVSTVMTNDSMCTSYLIGMQCLKLKSNNTVII